jgi:photosystem II stability/assembly factor-like uncharacterized protein
MGILIKKRKNEYYLGIILGISLLVLSSQAIAQNCMVSQGDITELIEQLPVGWEQQSSGTTQNLWGVSFADSFSGNSIGDFATILRTDNGGDNWNPQSCGVSSNLYAVSLYDSSLGMAVGNDGSILTTSNGGTTWSTYQTGWLISYYGAHMITSSIGFAAGVNTINQPLVTWTTNGWTSHNDVAFYFEQASVMYEGQIRDIQSIDGTICYAVGRVWNGEGAIAQTTNGGSIWSTIHWTSDALYCIDFPSVNIGYAAGANGILIKTTDGGSSWTPLTSGVTTNLNDISFSEDNIGNVVGDNGVILRTEDGGTTWMPQQSGVTSTLTSIDFVDNLNGFIAGESGIILHTSNGGWDNQPPNIPEIPDGPDTGATNIEYTFTTSTTDPEGEDVYYKFNWGDGTISDWIGPYPSGNTGESSYIWSTSGNFEIRVKAKDINEAESDWSEPHTIDIAEGPIMEIKPISTGFFRIKATIKNTGVVEVLDVAWSIALDGGAFIGKETIGTIASILPGEQVEIQSDLIIGIGPTIVTVTAEVDPGVSDSREQDGTVLLFLILINPGGG